MFYRAVPGDEPAILDQMYSDKVSEIKAAMQAIRPEADVVLERRFSVPPLKPEEAGESESLARAITGDNASHVVSYGTEAGQFQAAGYSAVVCGPGDIAQAHQPNEFIEVEQFESGHQFMRDLLEKLK
jgi:acetylornithine deacetylase